jgi:hypothetical protein
MPDLTPVGISQIQLALVTLGAGSPPPEHWVKQLVAAAEPLLEDMELLQLCNFGFALAQWNHCPPQVIDQCLSGNRYHVILFLFDDYLLQ